MKAAYLSFVILVLICSSAVAAAARLPFFGKTVKVNGVEKGAVQVGDWEIKVLGVRKENYSPGILFVEITNHSYMSQELKLSDFSVELSNGEKAVYRRVQWRPYLGSEFEKIEEDRRKQMLLSDQVVQPRLTVKKEITFDRELKLGKKPAKLFYKDQMIAELTM